MNADDPRHGTERGHEQHRRDGEIPCADCRHGDLVAGRRRHKRKAMGHVYMLPLGEDNHRKLSALKRKGATWAQLAEWLDVSSSLVWNMLAGGPERDVYLRTYVAVRDLRPGRILTPIGITRRIRALSTMGYSPQRIAEAAGVHLDTVRDARTGEREFLALRVREQIADAYDVLHMQTPQAANDREAAGITRVRNLAARAEWAPPLAWDDIDDPDAEPYAPTRPGRPGHPVVLLAVLEDFDWLIRAGESEVEAAKRVGVALATIRDYRVRAARRGLEVAS